MYDQAAKKMARDQDVARRRGLAIFCSLLLIVFGWGIGHFLTPRPQPNKPIEISTPLPTSTPIHTPTPAPIRVHVSGAVQQPAVYELPVGSIVQDAVDAAEGPTSDADLDHINLAVELRDQQQVYVPRQGETDPPPVVSGGESSSSGGGTVGAQVNINTATTAELETLPRIGPMTAQRILEYREANGLFATIEDIQNVPGIGPATFEGFQDMISVGP